MTAGLSRPRASGLSARPHPERGGFTSTDTNARPRGARPSRGTGVLRASRLGRGRGGGAQVAGARPAEGGPPGEEGRLGLRAPRGPRPTLRAGSPRVSPRPRPAPMAPPPMAPPRPPRRFLKGLAPPPPRPRPSPRPPGLVPLSAPSPPQLPPPPPERRWEKNPAAHPQAGPRGLLRAGVKIRIWAGARGGGAAAGGARGGGAAAGWAGCLPDPAPTRAARAVGAGLPRLPSRGILSTQTTLRVCGLGSLGPNPAAPAGRGAP